MGIITLIIVGKLKSAGLVVRMDQQRPTKRILKAKPEGRREIKKRPIRRWEDGADNDVKALVKTN
jgi:hypothetical protein